MNRPYRADTGRANRLHAARKQAGFRSAREAAIKHGWPVKTYQAHETANLHFDDATAKTYAAAFEVAVKWLQRAEGNGPAVDEARRARFEARKRTASPPELGPAGRLRAARRLAGYRSVAAAAGATRINRTTVSAHEAGQNQIPRDAAIVYGRAYAVDPEWLLSGKPPSKPPRVAAAILDELIGMHWETEKRAFDRFAHVVRRTPPDFRPPEEPQEDSRKEPKPAAGDPVREFSARSLFLKLWDEPGGIPSATWTFPKGYLGQIYGCDASTTVLLVVPHSLPGADAGSRILIDTGVTESTGDAVIAIVTEEGLLELAFSPTAAGALRNLAPERKIAGRVAAYFGKLPSPHKT
jgi:hypothetical protein